MPRQSSQAGGGKSSHGKGKGQSSTNINQLLKGIDFPCSQDDLVQQAKQNGADQTVITLILSMPDRDYGNMADVMKSYNETREQQKAA